MAKKNSEKKESVKAGKKTAKIVENKVEPIAAKPAVAAKPSATKKSGVKPSFEDIQKQVRDILAAKPTQDFQAVQSALDEVLKNNNLTKEDYNQIRAKRNAM